MEIRDGPGGEDSPMVFLSYCARHAKPQPHLSGGWGSGSAAAPHG